MSLWGVLVEYGMEQPESARSPTNDDEPTGEKLLEPSGGGFKGGKASVPAVEEVAADQKRVPLLSAQH